MANVAHSTLAGSDLHEPKGIGSAAASTVYIANGAGSGSWGAVSTLLSFTGMIADFATPVAPTGWLECDGSTISRTTYSDLFTANTIQGNGTRTSGSAIITSLSSTTHMRAGYYIGGTGIPNGTTISSVDSATQITMSANATSSGTSTTIVSPWALGDGSTTFTLPNVTTAGRFRRSRTSSVHMGTSQADQNQAHTHTFTTSSDGAHSHTITITDPGHRHSAGINSTSADQESPDGRYPAVTNPSAQKVYRNSANANFATDFIGTNTTGITASSNSTGSHTHTGTTASSGGTEARPLSLVVLTCIKY